MSKEKPSPGANSRQEGKEVAHLTEMFTKKYLNLVCSNPQ